MNLRVVGNVSWDTAHYADASFGPFLGGAGFNVSVGAAYAGAQAELMSVVSPRTRAILNTVAPFQVHQVAEMEGTDCAFAIRYEDWGVSSIQCDYGVARWINAYLLSAKTDSDGFHTHISCRHPLAPLIIAERVADLGHSYSLDFFVSSAPFMTAGCAALFEGAQWIFVNETEFQCLLKRVAIADLQHVVVTSGGLPVRVIQRGVVIDEVHVPNILPIEVTGAGDAFTGAFLGSRIGLGHNISTALGVAVSVAARTLSGPGVWPLLHRCGAQ